MLRKIPRSWLMPRVFVHRSALAPTTATALLVDEDRLKLSEPNGDHSMPLLPHVAVHRSALPAMTAEVPRLPENWTARLGSSSVQLMPSLPTSVGWLVIAAPATPVVTS